MISAEIERCAGIDAGEERLAVCVMVGPLAGEPRVEYREFGAIQIRPRFVPPRGLRALRDWTRRRQKMMAAGVSERDRVDKILQDANVKRSNALSDIFGVSGQLMWDALLEGKA